MTSHTIQKQISDITDKYDQFNSSSAFTALGLKNVTPAICKRSSQTFGGSAANTTTWKMVVKTVVIMCIVILLLSALIQNVEMIKNLVMSILQGRTDGVRRRWSGWTISKTDRTGLSEMEFVKLVHERQQWRELVWSSMVSDFRNDDGLKQASKQDYLHLLNAADAYAALKLKLVS